MDDYISRRAAIDKFEPWLKVSGYSEGELNMLKAVLYELRFLPSAQPERKSGKWIKSSNMFKTWCCSECGEEAWYRNYGAGVARSFFCPRCGADMRGDTDEQ